MVTWTCRYKHVWEILLPTDQMETSEADVIQKCKVMLEAILEDPEKEEVKSLFDEMTWNCTQSVEFLGFLSRYFTVFVNPVSADGADGGVLSWLCGHRHRTFSVSSPGRELAGQRGQHGSDHSCTGR